MSSSCPVDHKGSETIDQQANGASALPSDQFASGCPVHHGTSMHIDPSQIPAACPVSSARTVHKFLEGAPAFPPAARGGETTGVDSVGDVFPDSKPIFGQRFRLSPVPSRSNIPKSTRSGPPPSVSLPQDAPQVPSQLKDAAATVAAHLACTSDEAETPGSPSGPEDTWTFPSHQRFYNAMKKKGWNPNELDIPYIVSVHNTVNQQVWQRILQYEKYHASSCSTPKLLKFQGRPTDLSPKAKLMSTIGYSKPFDRHDWIVDRCGTDVRYIIDFYDGPEHPTLPVSTHIDARPALDSPTAVIDRVRAIIDEFFQMRKI